jgi:hypothetical protein
LVGSSCSQGYLEIIKAKTGQELVNLIEIKCSK